MTWTLWPVKKETLVSPHSFGEVWGRLWKRIKPVEEGVLMPDLPEDSFRFNGRLESDGHFRMSRKINHPENFLPMIQGAIEEAQSGSIIFLKFGLFFSTRAFLIFWSTISVLVAIFFFLYKDIQFYGMMALLFGVLNYIITIVKFNIEVARSRREIEAVLED